MLSNPPDPATPPVAPTDASPVIPAGAPPAPATPPTVPTPDPAAFAAMQTRLAEFEAAEATRAQEVKDRADAELSDLQKAQRTIAEMSITASRNAALIAHPVPAEYQSLVQGTDAASFLASAKLASELAAKAAGVVPPPPKPDPVPGSGTGNNASGGATGLLDAGRDLYNQRHKKSS